jgi:hypothetical protein
MDEIEFFACFLLSGDCDAEPRLRELHEHSNPFALASIEQGSLCDRGVEMHESVRIHSGSNFLDDILRDAHGIVAQCHHVLHAERTLEAARVTPGLMTYEDISRKERRKSTARSHPREKNEKALIPEIRLRPRFAMDFRVNELPF